VIIASIRERILTMPPQTEVHPGHGGSTTVGEEAPHLQEWIDRGW
jgi:glyoxylase-like metal-dependent hydrolase (beta-lactamase superfamily II)